MPNTPYSKMTLTKSCVVSQPMIPQLSRNTSALHNQSSLSEHSEERSEHSSLSTVYLIQHCEERSEHSTADATQRVARLASVVQPQHGVEVSPEVGLSLTRWEEFKPNFEV